MRNFLVIQISKWNGGGSSNSSNCPETRRATLTRKNFGTFRYFLARTTGDNEYTATMSGTKERRKKTSSLLCSSRGDAIYNTVVASIHRCTWNFSPLGRNEDTVLSGRVVVHSRVCTFERISQRTGNIDAFTSEKHRFSPSIFFLRCIHGMKKHKYYTCLYYMPGISTLFKPATTRSQLMARVPRSPSIAANIANAIVSRFFTGTGWRFRRFPTDEYLVARPLDVLGLALVQYGGCVVRRKSGNYGKLN